MVSGWALEGGKAFSESYWQFDLGWGRRSFEVKTTFSERERPTFVCLSKDTIAKCISCKNILLPVRADHLFNRELSLEGLAVLQIQPSPLQADAQALVLHKQCSSIC